METKPETDTTTQQQKDLEMDMMSTPKTTISKLQKLAIFMVGLPARGKSYISTSIVKFLKWSNYNARVFNVGNERRKMLKENQDAKFFDPSSEVNTSKRTEIAMSVLEDMLKWLFEEDGEVAIHDATNSTRARRRQIRERCAGIPNLQIIFLESICNDQEVLEKNIQLKLFSPDYRSMDVTVARNDFLDRLKNYEKAYEPILNESFPFIKVEDVGRKVVVNNIKGYLAGQLVFYLMNMHIQDRTIYLTRHGESRDNVLNRIGGDALLSSKGEDYSVKLAEWVKTLGYDSMTVWTSTLRRTVQTARFLPEEYPKTHHRLLNELFSGSCEGMTYEEIEHNLPEIHKERNLDKLNFRYPYGGESYQDLIIRLRPMVIELERLRGPVLLIAHQAVLRTIYSYFVGEPIEKIPFLDIPLHTVICLKFNAFGCTEERIKLL